MSDEVSRVNELIEELSSEIIRAEPQPSQWSGWMVRLLEKLEFQAAEVDEDRLDGYEEMLEILQEVITERLQGDRW